MNSQAVPPIAEEDLVRYIDNELPAERRREVEAYLKENPEAAAWVEADRQIAVSLRTAYSRVKAEPPSLVEPSRGRWLPRTGIAASIAAALLVGVFAGWSLKPEAGQPGQQPFLTDALTAHRTFTVEVAHPVEVAASDQRHLATWLGNRLNHPFRIPDLRVAGLTLMGGRLLPSGIDPAAQLMYDDEDGKRVTVYLRRGVDGEPKFQFVKSGTEQAFFWSDTAFTYAVTGDMPRPELLNLAHLIQTQFDPSQQSN
ncbi:Predicted transmembrane transcriptional regulator [Stappia aggregata IAM 12614]|uniref:Predicted transmembrane transcriptional regulator n=1 Tax=Roseibium aggregatum (strain ATCC 25650 / DSM 13394 / JCM 20685 / NBRC 16684 / NCIMB 2208 / IAM 12614 / B1) TaxID=384765 RepID=A0P1Z1_ROSAI|nr:anti-sigma factor [Roseibium aggregatum]EAV41067.1 Predicted transmembrane transcriptional regulator [Stappia aggregata IAM 12614] [Roseibium aggregatum IAM 12614]